MKLFKRLLVISLVVLGTVVPASAQFRIGPRLGITTNEMHFSSDLFDSDNRTGFTGGLMAEFTVPIIGVGLDASVMYARRNGKFHNGEEVIEMKRDYIAVPVNLKWNINIPVINNIVRPYLATGPEFDFLTSKEFFNNVRNKKFDFAWNFGFGVTLLKHLQVGASYGIGLTKSAVNDSDAKSSDWNGKDRFWTVTAAYLF